MKKDKEKILLDKLIQQIQKTQKQDKSLADVPRPKEKYKLPKKKTWLVYLFSILTPIVAILIGVSMWLLGVRVLYIIIYTMLAIPLFLGSSIVFWIRLYLDRKKIKGTIVKKVTRNFIIANFWQENKQKFQEVILIKGKDFEIGDEMYLIDKEAIYYDQNKYPNLDYLRGIPNPLKYNFRGLLDKYQTAIQSGKKEEIQNVLDFDGEVIDVSYSSANLKTFKKDKIFSDLHTSRSELSMGNVITWVMLAIMLIILLFVLTKG